MTRRGPASVVSSVAIGLVVALALLVTACGGSSSPSSTSRPLTSDEAGRLASTLYANHLGAGASFSAHSAFLAVTPQQSLDLQGEMDWTDHVGRAYVSGNGPNAGLTEVIWDSTTIYERRPGLDPLIAGLGGPASPWIARPPEPQKRQLDRLLAIITGLAAEQAENATLIQQTEGSSYLRPDTLRETSVDVMRYGTRNIYWVQSESDRMLRFEGNSEGGTTPTIVDLLERHAVTLTVPPPQYVVAVASIRTLYDAATSGG